LGMGSYIIIKLKDKGNEVFARRRRMPNHP
jgi:hypothetical protein